MTVPKRLVLEAFANFRPPSVCRSLVGMTNAAPSAETTSKKSNDACLSSVQFAAGYSRSPHRRARGCRLAALPIIIRSPPSVAWPLSWRLTRRRTHADVLPVARLKYGLSHPTLPEALTFPSPLEVQSATERPAELGLGTRH